MLSNLRISRSLEKTLMTLYFHGEISANAITYIVEKTSSYSAPMRKEVTFILVK